MELDGRQGPAQAAARKTTAGLSHSLLGSRKQRRATMLKQRPKAPITSALHWLPLVPQALGEECSQGPGVAPDQGMSQPLLPGTEEVERVDGKKVVLVCF